MAIRLKKDMDRLILPNQSAFVGGRLIQDNIIITHECLYRLKQAKTIAKNSFLAKIDMSKAFNRLEWDYLKACLKAFGFCSTWIGGVMKFVWTVSYRLKINGIPSRRIKPQRRLHQGDPLSPYLLILAMEGLSHLLKTTVEEGRILVYLREQISHILSIQCWDNQGKYLGIPA